MPTWTLTVFDHRGRTVSRLETASGLVLSPGRDRLEVHLAPFGQPRLARIREGSLSIDDLCIEAVRGIDDALVFAAWSAMDEASIAGASWPTMRARRDQLAHLAGLLWFVAGFSSRSRLQSARRHGVEAAPPGVALVAWLVGPSGPETMYTFSPEDSDVDSHEKRFERIERTMEFLVDSDAKLSVRLDSLAATVERQQAEISSLGDLVAETREDVRGIHAEIHDMHGEIHGIRLETREAITRMIEIAEGIAATATTFAERSTDHEIRVRRLERQPPSDAA